MQSEWKLIHQICLHCGAGDAKTQKETENLSQSNLGRAHRHSSWHVSLLPKPNLYPKPNPNPNPTYPTNPTTTTS